MASVVTCPKCQTRLKLNKVPAEATRIQCPHCHNPFSISNGAGQGGITARRPAAAPPAAPARPPAAAESFMPSPHGFPPPPPSRPARGRPRPAQRRPLIGTGAALIIALAIVGVGAAGIYVFYRPASSSDNQANNKDAPEGGKTDKDNQDADKHIKQLRESASKYMKARKYKDAMSSYAEILKQLPNDAEATEGQQRARDYMAKLEQKKPAPDAAKEADVEIAQQKAKEAEEKRAADLAAFLKQGNDALSMNQLVQAEDSFKKALDTAPGNEDATRGLLAVREKLAQAEVERRYTDLLGSARSHLAAMRYTDAMRDAAAAQQLMPADASAAREIYRQAEAQLTMLTDADDRKQAYMKVMDFGNAAMRDMRFPEAFEAYTSALKLVPDDPAAAKGLADAKTAIDQYNAQLALLKQQSQALIAQGDLAMKAGLFANAVQLYGQASLLMPNDPNARAKYLWADGAMKKLAAYQMAMDRGRNAMVARQYADAILAYNDAVTNAPGDPFAFAARQGLDNAQRLLLGTLQTKQLVDIKLAQAAEFMKKAALENDFMKKQPFYVQARDLYLDADRIMPDNPDNLAIKNLYRFADAMARGTASFNARIYGQATNAFLEAVRTVMDDPVAQQALQQSVLLGQKLYDDSMGKGKKAMDARNYPEAIARYFDALGALTDDPLADATYPELPVSRAAAKMGLDEAQRLGKARFDDDMNRAKVAMDARNYPEAINQYADALRILPNDPTAQQGLNDAQRLLQLARDFDNRVQQANQYLKQQRFSDARDAFNDLVKLAPTPTQAQAMKDQSSYADAMGRGQSAMTLKQYPDAVLAYGDALRVFPKDVPANQGLQQAQKLAGGGDLAKNFDAAVKAADQLFNLQKYADASKAYNDAIKMQPSDPTVTLLTAKALFSDAMNKGQQAMTARNYPSALAAFNGALKQFPDNPQALQARDAAQMLIDGANLATLFDGKVKDGDKSLAALKYDQAVKTYTDAINLLPREPRVPDVQSKIRYANAMLMGQSAMTSRSYMDAVNAYNAALKERLGDLAATQGLQAAEKQLTGASQNVSDKIAAADKLLAGQKYPEAGKAYNDVIALIPGDGRVAGLQTKANFSSAMVQAQAAMKASQFSDAVASYKQALGLINDPAAAKGLQDAEARLAGAQSAQEVAKKLAAARTYLEQHKYLEASKTFNEAIALLPANDPQVAGLTKKVHYADAMANGRTALSAKNYQAAAGFFGTALKAQPGDIAANQGLQEANLGNQAGQAKQHFDAKVTQGNLALAQEKYADAARLLNDAVNLLPTDKSAPAVQQRARYADAMARGKAAMSTKNYAGAVTAFNDAVSKAPPGDMTAQRALTDAQQQQQQAAGAAAAAQQKRKDFDAKVAQANSLLNQKQPRYADASQLLHEAVRLIPDDPNARELTRKADYADHMARGHTAMTQRKFQDAATQFQAAVNLYPGDHAAMSALNNARKAK